MLIIISLASFAVYLNTLSYGFVFDDMMQVLQNPWIRDVKFLPEIFSKSVWGFHGGEHIASDYYRPLMNAIYMINYHIFGLRPWGFHFVNVLFHVANSLLVFVILEKLFPSTTFASSLPFAAALLFSVHPIHTEAVTWVCGITDISYTFFFLLSFYFFIVSATAIMKREYLFSLISFSLSLLCKEPAVVLPVILVAYDFAFGNKGQPLRSRAKRYAPYFVILCIYFVVRSHALGGFIPMKPQRDLTPFSFAMNVFPLFAQYLEKLLLPINLSAFHAFKPVVSMLEAKELVALAVTMCYLIFCIIAFRKNRAVFFGLALIAVPLLPALHISSLGESVLAERYLYLPSVGFVFLLAILFVRLREKLQGYRIAVTLAVIFLAGFYSIQTVIRNPVWKNNLTLYADMAKKSPESESPLDNYANALFAEGRVDEAIEQYRAIITKINPNSEKAYFNLGLSLQRKGLLEEAVKSYEKSLSLNQHSIFASSAYFNLAFIFFQSGQTDNAIDYASVAVRLQPGNAFYHNMLGICYGKKGLYDEAIRELESAIRLAPEEPSFRWNLDRAMALKAGAVILF